MYKVFIDNREVLFTESNPQIGNYVTVSADTLDEISLDFPNKTGTTDQHQSIVVLCKSLENDFNRLFRNYEKIDAAGGIVKNGKKYLFIKRNGFWDIPKGKVDEGESIEQAAVREIEEECGISGLKLKELILTTFHTYDYHGTPTIKKTYWYYMDYHGDEKCVPQAEEGITKVKWFAKDQLDKVRKNTFLSILEVVDCYFGQK